MIAMYRVFPVFILFFLSAATQVWAQTGVSSGDLPPQLIDPRLYATIQKNAAVEEMLKGRDPTVLTTEELNRIFEQTASLTTLPLIGNVFSQGDEYTFFTGLSGVAMGLVRKGEYDVSLDQVSGVEVTLPGRKVITRASDTNELLIAFRHVGGKGSVVVAGETQTGSLNWFDRIKIWLTSSGNRLFARLPFGKQEANPLIADAVAGAFVSTMRYTVKLYNDENGNNQLDAEEKLVPWGNVPVKFRKISHEEVRVLGIGDNNVSITPVPKNFTTTHGLLNELILEGVRNASVTGPGLPTAVKVFEETIIGEDSTLIPGEYTFIVDVPVTLTLVY